MNKINHTNIPTAGIFGMKNAYCWNPVKGCANLKCHLHPSKNGECWAAAICRRFASIWAKNDTDWRTKNNLPVNITQYENIITKKIELIYPGEIELERFILYWFQSQFQKKFPKKRSCILVGYMTDIAFIPREWLKKIINRIIKDNEEREKAGLPLHIFQFLTKEPVIYSNFKFPINCWLGFTATNQEEYDEKLCDMEDPFGKYWNGTNLWYAYLEPLRESIKIEGNNSIPNWVIVGGGPQPVTSILPLKFEHVRLLRDQCQAEGIPFYFKQWSHKDKSNVLGNQKWEQFPEVNHE